MEVRAIPYLCTTKMAANLPVGHLWSDYKIKWCAYVNHHSLSVCQVWTRVVNACPRNGWERVWHGLVFFTTKMPASRPCLTWCRKKRHAYVYPHVLTLCRVRIKWVQTCPRYGCRCTHACKDTKIETKSISPLFRLSPTGEGGDKDCKSHKNKFQVLLLF